MKDWKTTVTGGVAGVCQLLGLFVPAAHQLCDPIGAAALALFGWFASDKSQSK